MYQLTRLGGIVGRLVLMKVVKYSRLVVDSVGFLSGVSASIVGWFGGSCCLG